MDQTKKSRSFTELEEENRQLRSTIEELSILNDIATAVSSSQSQEQIEKVIIKKCIKHLSVEEGAVMLLNEDDVSKPFQTLIRTKNSLMDSLPFNLDDQIMGWILKNKTSLMINNFKEDKRFYKNVDQEISLKSLLAVPMFVKGKLIGIIVLFNKVKGDFTNDDHRLLSICASQSAQIIESTRLYKQEFDLNRLKEEMQLATDIQKNLLPQSQINFHGYTIIGLTASAKEVGGDFFDFVPISEDKLAVWLGDVSGKGMPAALLMANLQGILRSRSFIDKDCKLCVEFANDTMLKTSDADKFATLFYAILDVKKNQITFASAGDNDLVQLKKNGDLKIYESSNIPIGIYHSYDFKETIVQLEKGDTLLVFSDGITDAENSAEELFGRTRFFDLLKKLNGLPPEELLNNIYSELSVFSQNCPQSDDQTLLIIKPD